MRTHEEFHKGAVGSWLNWLRAAVLGANDGIVSLAALVVGVAGATESSGAILITGIAGLLAGAFSMAVGEYVSVSSQRDTELALLDKERFELEHYPEAELEELTGLYEKKGLSRPTAEAVAKELTARDVFAAHVEAELRIDPSELINPWHAAFASAASFVAGALIPVIAISLPPASTRIPITFAAVLAALIVTGILSARTSGARAFPVTTRVVVGGIIAMAITFGIGRLVGEGSWTG
ncbi:MAG: hypothetical protein RLZZ416_816 [Candidatus Parcubacteria bacterium]